MQPAKFGKSRQHSISVEEGAKIDKLPRRMDDGASQREFISIHDLPDASSYE